MWLIKKIGISIFKAWIFKEGVEGDGGYIHDRRRGDNI